MKRPYIIGLTGTIGSGKSECSRIFGERLSLPVIDADKLAYEVVEPGSEGLELIKKEFGPEFALENGEYNRKLMGKLVSRDREALARLNAILHPLIRRKRDERFKELSGEAIIVYDCPLLFEVGEDKEVDEVLLVTVDEKERVKRIVERDGLTESEALSRINMQMSEREKIERADTVIFNNGTLEDLEAALKNFLKSQKRG